MSGLFVLARKASDMKFVTTKHGDAEEIPGQAYKNDIGRTVQITG